jgi:hypothetical protein
MRASTPTIRAALSLILLAGISGCRSEQDETYLQALKAGREALIAKRDYLVLLESIDPQLEECSAQPTQACVQALEKELETAKSHRADFEKELATSQQLYRSLYDRYATARSANGIGWCLMWAGEHEDAKEWLSDVLRDGTEAEKRAAEENLAMIADGRPEPIPELPVLPDLPGEQPEATAPAEQPERQ